MTKANSSTHELSWNKTSFLDKLRLFFKSRKTEKEKIQSISPMIQAEGYSELSSTYYSIAGTAFFQIKAMLKSKKLVQIIMWSLTWLPLATWCYWRMLYLSNRVVDLIGYDEMSAGQCDIRQSILRRRGDNVEAIKCIENGLKKNSVNAYTQGLLFIGLAEIYIKDYWDMAKSDVREVVDVTVQKAVSAAKKAEKEEPLQAARIYRSAAAVVDFLEEKEGRGFYDLKGKDLRDKAERLARESGAEDQILKQS